MGRLAGYIAVILVISILTIFPTASSQTMPKPSVPEFTMKYVDNSYVVPSTPPTTPTYTLDPYSGKQTLINPGSSGNPSYYVYNRTIELWIKNQEYDYSNGSVFHLCYDVQIKGHFGQDWTDLKPPTYSPTMKFTKDFNGTPALRISPDFEQSNSTFTVLSFPANYNDGDRIDFQVKSMVGHEASFYAGYYNIMTLFNDYFVTGIAYDTQSDWSPIQTFTMPITDTSTPSTGLLSNPTAIVALTVVIVCLVTLLALILRHRKTSNSVKKV
jgi:hypothetical protein